MRVTATPVHSSATQQPLWAYACLALSMSLVGSYVALSRPMLVVFPVFLLAWLRFGIGAVAMAHWLQRPADEAPLDRRTRQLLFLESFLGNFLFTVCMLGGMRLTSAVSAGVILAAIPATVALLSWLTLGERIDLRTGLAIACAAIGIGVLAWAGPGASPAAESSAMPWLGNLLIVGAVICEASYAVIGKRLTGALGPRRISAIINLWGLVLMTPLGAWAAWQFDFSTVGLNHWLLLLFYSLAASVWTVWLWMTGLKHVPAARAGVFTVMLPVASTAVGVAVLGESMQLAQGVALAFALLGIALATSLRQPQAATPPTPPPTPSQTTPKAPV